MTGLVVSVTASPASRAKLERLARALKETGNKDLRNELARGLRRAVKPMQREFRRGALGILPHRGGLAEWVADDTKFRSKVSVGRNPSVRITATLPGHDLDAMDRGRLRHPTFGHRDGPHWVTQTIRPHWFTDSGVLAAQDARDELIRAIDTVAAKLEASA